MSIVSHHADNVICHTCGYLTRFLILCDHCHDSIPLRTTFNPNKALARREVNPPTSSVRASMIAAKALRHKYRNIIHELKESCLQLDSFIEYQEARLSPIKRVPADVLIEIFRLAVHEQGISSRFGPTALHLTRICSSWRHLVSSVPSLWSCFSVECIRPIWEESWLSTGPPLETLELYIQRSHPVHLSIHFSAEDGNDWRRPKSASFNRAELFLQRIEQVAPRVAQLDIEDIHLRTFHRSFSSLTNLRVRPCSRRSNAGPSMSFHAPHLKSVVLYSESSFNVPLRFEKLTELQLGKDETAHGTNNGTVSLELLSSRTLPSLRYLRLCNLDQDRFGDESSDAVQRIELPALEVLCISISQRHVTLGQFLTPNLAELAITSNYNMPNVPAHFMDPIVGNDPHEVGKLFTNSSCTQTFRCLSIHGIDISPLSLTRIIDSHPAINDLSLKDLQFFPHPQGNSSESVMDQQSFAFASRESVDADFLRNLILSPSFPFSRLSFETNQSDLDEKTIFAIVMQSLGNIHLTKLKLELHHFFFGREAVRTIQEVCREQHGPEISIHTSVGASFLGREEGRPGMLRSPSSWGTNDNGPGWGQSAWGAPASARYHGLLRVV